jgi:hypothetical protein
VLISLGRLDFASYFCGVPVSFLLDLRFICFVPSPDRLACYVAQVANFPPGPVVAGLVFSSAGLSLVSASPDSSLSPAHELRERAASGFHFGFILDLRCSWVLIWIFRIRSSRYRLSCSSWSVLSFSHPGRTWCRSLPGPSALALVLSVHPGSLCKDSGRVFDFLRRLASPRTGLSRYLPQVRRALHRSVFSIDFAASGVGSPVIGLFGLWFQPNRLLFLALVASAVT